MTMNITAGAGGEGWLDKSATIAKPRLQPLAGSAGGARDSSLHRDGVWLFSVLEAARRRCRVGDRRQQADRLSRRRDNLLRQVGHNRPCAIRHRLRLDAVRPRLDVHSLLRGARILRGDLGGWLERAGPRKAGLVAAFCWAGGPRNFRRRRLPAPVVADVAGLRNHRRIGLGLGYISPVSTLVKWFPDRRGMATGMAIMGFGGGAMIGSPLATQLMAFFKTKTDGRGSGRPSW